MLAPPTASLRERVAAAVLESRLGGGSRRFRYLPGNVRIVADHPAETYVVRRSDFEATRAAGVDGEHLVAWLAERGRRTVYTPDASVSVPPAPFVGPHLNAVYRHARARGGAARATRGRSLSGATALSLAPTGVALAGGALLLSHGNARTAGGFLVLGYAGALAVSGAHAALRFRSAAVGLLEPPAVVASHVTYLGGFVRGLLDRPSRIRGR
jgi:hypothetical protein